MKDFQAYNLVELDSLEMKETNGGYIWLLRAVAGLIAAGCVADWSDFKKGISDGFSQ